MVFILSAQSLLAQNNVMVSGTVYDITARKPLDGVIVQSTSGRGALSDSTGHYSIIVRKADSIWFTMLNKSTMKYAVDTIRNLDHFDISLYIRADVLPEVKVFNRSYRLDSIQNRLDYAKYFNYKKPGIGTVSTPYTPGGLAVGFDLDEIINMFRFRRNRNLTYLQNRLLQQEQDGYINHRFSKALVRKITKLQSPELESFMAKYRPTYEFVQMVNDLELGYYIEKCFEQYKTGKNK
jgi:hypothetical protein